MSDRIRAALQRLVEALDDYDPKWDAFPEAELTAARAALAEPVGEQPAPAAVGEVGELVEWLRANALTVQKASGNPANGAKQRMNRAADLLEQRHPAPVPVAERLPGPEDCDEEHCCWRWNTIGGLWARQPLARSWYEFESHWLPAHDLPLPAGEVE